MWQTTSFEHLFSTIQYMNPFNCTIVCTGPLAENLVHNIPSFRQLHQMCDSQREHEPWGQKPDGAWATSEETAYPWPLARAIAAQVVLQLQDQGLVCHLPSFAEQECTLQAMRASTNIQPRKHLPPMVPEFKQVIHQNSNGSMSRVPKKTMTTKSR